VPFLLSSRSFVHFSLSGSGFYCSPGCIHTSLFYLRFHLFTFDLISFVSVRCVRSFTAFLVLTCSLVAGKSAGHILHLHFLSHCSRYTILFSDAFAFTCLLPRYFPLVHFRVRTADFVSLPAVSFTWSRTCRFSWACLPAFFVSHCVPSHGERTSWNLFIHLRSRSLLSPLPFCVSTAFSCVLNTALFRSALFHFRSVLV